jgi:hypothetical protein
MGRSSCGSSSLANACCWRVPASLVRATAAVRPKVWQGIRTSGYCSACPGNLDPSRVPVTSDLPANETAEGTAVDPVVAVAYDRAVDVAGDNQDKRVAGCFDTAAVVRDRGVVCAGQGDRVEVRLPRS